MPNSCFKHYSIGLPLSLIKKNKIFTYSSNYTLYGDMSSRVMSSLNYFVPDMEIYSIDEAFLDLRKFNIKTISEEMFKIRQFSATQSDVHSAFYSSTCLKCEI